MKNNNTIIWIIGIVILFLVLSPQIDFKGMFAIGDYSPDSENLVYQVHEGIKLIEDGCIIEQRNSGTYDTYLSCSTWLYREQEDGYIDFSVQGTPFLWHKDGIEWRWIYEMSSSIFGCQLKYYKTGLWTYLAAVKLDGGRIIKEISDLYTYTNSDLGLPIKESYIGYISPDWIMRGTCPLGTYTYEESIIEVDDCGSFGAVDPFIFNGLDELKCDAYCRAGLRECIVRADGLNESQYCIIDGSEIEHEICYSGCENGICTERPMIEISSLGDHNYGDDVAVIIRLFLGEEPYAFNLIIGRLEVGGASISETSNYTNGNGYTTLNFEDVKAGGYVSLVVSTTIRGIETQETTEIFFSGIPIIFELTTESYSQSNAGNITFLVEVTDAQYQPVHEELVTNLHADTNLSAGTVLGNSITYLGSGIYEVSSEVDGTGVFSGRLLFDYQGESFESPSINIDVEYATISIGTVLIQPLAILETEETFTITFASSLGELIDPDNITIRISLPTGYEEDILTTSDLRRIALGTYEFDYYFSQVEKYSFDIYADKEGFTRGNAKATVSVAGANGWLGPGPGFGFGNLEYVFYAIIILIVLFIIIGRRKKKVT